MVAEVDFRLSGGGANSDPNASLGGAISPVEIVNADVPNLFANVGTQEGTDGSDKYRCIYISPPALNYIEMGIWISTPTISTDTTLYIGVAPEGKNGTAELVANEDIEPANVLFTRPTQDSAALDLPDLNAGEFIAVWLKRTVKADAAGFDNDYARLTVRGTEV